MTETWANIVTKNITFKGPPPGFKLLPHCLCKNCKQKNTILKTFQFSLNKKLRVENILLKQNVHYKIQRFSQKYEIELFVCNDLWKKILQNIKTTDNRANITNSIL